MSAAVDPATGERLAEYPAAGDGIADDIRMGPA